LVIDLDKEIIDQDDRQKM